MTSLKSVIPATHVWLEVTSSGSHNAWRRTSPVTPLNLMQTRKHCSSVGLESKARLCKWLPELGSGRLSFWIQNVWLQGQVCFTHHIALLGFSRALRVGHIHVICLSVNFFSEGCLLPESSQAPHLEELSSSITIHGSMIPLVADKGGLANKTSAEYVCQWLLSMLDHYQKLTPHLSLLFRPIVIEWFVTPEPMESSKSWPGTRWTADGLC